MGKNDLKKAAAKGADLFFSKSTDEQESCLKDAVEASQKVQAESTGSNGENRGKRQEKRINISLSVSGYEYCKLMGRVSGKGMSRFIADMVDREASANSEKYKRAKEFLNDV